MATIEIIGTELFVHVEGLDRLLAFTSELRVPLVHVAGVEGAADEARRWWHGIRAPGTNFPGVITAGTFFEPDGRIFWDVHDPERAIEIRLRDESYAKLVIEVADPRAAIAAVAAALATACLPIDETQMKD
jgi:hypothetical protein